MRYILFNAAFCWAVVAQEPLENRDRDVLMRLFESTSANFNKMEQVAYAQGANGDVQTSGNKPGWLTTSFWGSDEPVGKWFGVTTDITTGRVTKLELYANNMHGQIPDLSGLDAIQEMDLRSNSLSGTIPASIGSLTSLTHLYLSANMFSGGIPETIGFLINLERLYISYASISGTIPETIGKLKKLERLDLSENSLSGKAPRSLRNLTRLQVLYLSHNSLSIKEKNLRNMLPKCQWINV